MANFGLSKKENVGGMGSPFWMGPELLRGETTNTMASDVYSFGIILYEVYSRRDPYEGENATEVLRLVADRTVNKRPPIPKSCPPQVQCLIGNGVVLSIPALFEEVKMLEDAGVNVRERLMVSQGCPLILPHHIALDQIRETVRGNQKIGTTGRGIGPAYEDKVARRGLRVIDMYQPEQFKTSLAEIMDYHNFVLKNYFNTKTVSLEETLDASLAWAEELRPMVGDVVARLGQLQRDNANVLFEGAQGSLLDIDQGTYPFVTSSNTTAGAIGSGCGVGPLDLDYILGITKAYTTRVGSGPFPTELFDEVGAQLGKRGNEFGSTTGRPRRCGWFDAYALKRAIQVNSLSGLCITKLDVLDGLETLSLCSSYDETDPLNPKPVYEVMPGWQENSAGVRQVEDLPANARAYLKRIEEVCGIPIDIISTGPDRRDTIVLRDLFAE